MTFDPTDREIENALSEKPPPLTDAGFSAQVMRTIALEQRRADQRTFGRRTVALAAGALALGAALWLFREQIPGLRGSDFQNATEWLRSTSGNFNASTVAIIVFCGAVLYFMDSRDPSHE